MDKYFNSIEERLIAKYADCVTDRAQKTARYFVEKRHGDLSGYAAEQGRKFDNLIRDYVIPHIKVVRKVGYKSPITLEVLRAVNIYKRKGYVELIKSLHPSLFVVKKQAPMKNNADIGRLNAQKVQWLADAYKASIDRNGYVPNTQVLYENLAGSKGNKTGNVDAINHHFNHNVSFTNEGIDFLLEKGFSLVDYVSGRYNDYPGISSKLSDDAQKVMYRQLQAAHQSVYGQQLLSAFGEIQSTEPPSLVAKAENSPSMDYTMPYFSAAIDPDTPAATPPKIGSGGLYFQVNSTGRSSRRGAAYNSWYGQSKESSKNPSEPKAVASENPAQKVKFSAKDLVDRLTKIQSKKNEE